MIIFLDAGGKILAASPEKVGRNSNLATSIYIVAPFVSDTTVYLTFRLPNGEELFGGIAREEEELPYEDAAQKAAYLFTASGFSVWKYALPGSVTLYAGTVQYTVVTLTESMRATSTGTFAVSKGNRLIFPDAEPENAWELLTNAVKALENTLYDAGELPPELGANSLAERVAKAENALEGKLDKITDVAQTGNFGGAYVLNPDGTQGMMKITNTVSSGTIPVRGAGGVVVVGTPTADAHAADKGYVDKVVDTKVDKDTSTGGLWVYGRNAGEEKMWRLATSPQASYIPIYAGPGILYTDDPTKSTTGDMGKACANKKYVDDLAATKLDIKDPPSNNVSGITAYIKRLNSETGETYYDQNFKRICDGRSSVLNWNLPEYLPSTATYGSDPISNGPVLLSGEPKLPIHVATKNYVDKAVEDLNALGVFYKVVKVSGSGTIFVEIPTGAMATAYIESGAFDAYNVDGTLVYTGTANGLYFLDENWMDISFISFTAPAYIQIPENARQIRLNCDELVPSDVGWDAGPVTFNGYIFFLVKRGG